MSQRYTETIISELLTALGGISIAGGYNTDIASIARWDRTARDRTSGSHIEVRRVREFARREGLEWIVSLTVWIDWLMIEDSTDGRTTDEEVSDAVQDLLVALGQLPAAVYERLETAGDDHFGDLDPDSEDQGFRLTLSFAWREDLRTPGPLTD